ncbi:MAG: hypothetical protein EOM23_00445 [Candidatus Moranbacteria bacterium]|nr:hypothetical protein [Candidatus Moranbacteria bacterium]
MFKKIFFVLFIIFFFLFFVFLGAAIIYSQQKKISLWQELREDSKRIINQMAGIVYREGEKHNPEGDLLPDWIDDWLKKEIKERI